ncbi:NTP transferase domain-containing protein [Candidatus Bipolaricaulota bacterium]|nr:NTP transferase domain-containing protein [Candidatus Bipolaricaulota bacterium]
MDCVILAAGKGTRMSSSRPKVLHEVGGKPLIGHLLDSIDPLSLSKIVVVVGYKEKQVRKALSDRDLEFALQEEQKGTAHALQQAKGEIISDSFLVFPGDLPLVKHPTLKEFIDFAQDGDLGMSILTVNRENPDGYGRIKRSVDGTIKGIVEDQDANKEEKRIKEINTGIYLLSNDDRLWGELDNLDSTNAQGEFYLTDLVKEFSLEGKEVTGKKFDDPEEFLGVNTQKDLSFAGEVLNRRKIASLQNKGVTILDPKTTRIDGDVEVGQDTVISPFTMLKKRTKIGREARIGPGTEIVDSKIGNRVEISHSVIEGARVEDKKTIGPFQHLQGTRDTT